MRPLSGPCFSRQEHAGTGLLPRRLWNECKPEEGACLILSLEMGLSKYISGHFGIVKNYF